MAVFTASGESMPVTEVAVTRRIGGCTVHLNQLVVQPKADDFDQHFIVLRFTKSGVVLNDTDFNGEPFEVDDTQWKERGYRPKYAYSLPREPVWAY